MSRPIRSRQRRRQERSAADKRGEEIERATELLRVSIEPAITTAAYLRPRSTRPRVNLTYIFYYLTQMAKAWLEIVSDRRTPRGSSLLIVSVGRLASLTLAPVFARFCPCHARSRRSRPSPRRGNISAIASDYDSGVRGIDLSRDRIRIIGTSLE